MLKNSKDVTKDEKIKNYEAMRNQDLDDAQKEFINTKT